ncbi:hypothetical protein [Rahnella sp. R3(2024)]|uniref:hypothetical protein n=1 Tax=Rahnella sp. R3(2024) TaxID=3163550 RepID=UPI0036E6F0E1
MPPCIAPSRAGKGVIIWADLKRDLLCSDNDLIGFFGIANNIIRNAFIDKRHRTNHNIITNRDVVPNDAAVRANIDIIANGQEHAFHIIFDSNRRILPDADIFPYVAIGINHDTCEMGQPDPFTNLRTQHNFNVVFFDEGEIDLPRTAFTKMAVG